MSSAGHYDLGEHLAPREEIQRDSSEQCFRQIFTDLKQKGKMTSPRGLKVIEIENYAYELPTRVRFCNFASRKLNLDYIKREFLWYLRGDPFDLSITQHAKMWQGLVTDQNTINSNYGQYLFGKPVTGIDGAGFDFVVKQLKEDMDSRRASVPILAARHLRTETKDMPCTYSLNFRIRENALNMSVHMRSQDAVFGMGNDAPCFSFIQEMVWAALLDNYPELQLGTYHHIADSFHVYERHFDVMEKIVNGDAYIPVDCPSIKNPAEVRHLKDLIHKTYSYAETEPEYRTPTNPDLIEAIKFFQRENFNFSTWLTTFDK